MALAQGEEGAEGAEGAGGRRRRLRRPFLVSGQWAMRRGMCSRLVTLHLLVVLADASLFCCRERDLFLGCDFPPLL